MVETLDILRIQDLISFTFHVYDCDYDYDYDRYVASGNPNAVVVGTVAASPECA